MAVPPESRGTRDSDFGEEEDGACRSLGRAAQRIGGGCALAAGLALGCGGADENAAPGGGSGGRSASGAVGGMLSGAGGEGSESNGGGGERSSSGGGFPSGGADGDPSGTGGTGAGTGGASTHLTIESPVDVNSYFPELEPLCSGEDPCPAGACVADTNPCSIQTPYGIISVSTQEQFDEIKDCTSLDVDLTFYGSELSSLEGLSLVRIDGNLRIRMSTLTSLKGLESLMSIGGSLYLGSSDQEESPMLTDLTGLSGLRYVKNALSIQSISTLKSLDPLSSAMVGTIGINNKQLANVSALLDVCTSALFLGGSDVLTSIDDLPLAPEMSQIDLLDLPLVDSLGPFRGWTRIYASLRIAGLAALPDLEDLSQLEAIRGALTIDDNALIQDLSDLSKLEVIGGSLSIGGPSITTLGGLSSLVYLSGISRIDGAAFASTAGLTSLVAMGYLADGEDLAGVALEDLVGVEYIQSIRDDGDLSLAPFPNLQQVKFMELGDGSDDLVLPESLTRIGTLKLTGTPVVDLRAFQGAKVLERLFITRSDTLTSLDGLTHDGDFSVELLLTSLPALRDISALEGLSSVEGEVHIEETGLTAVGGLNQLRSVGDLTIQYNPELLNLDGLIGLEEVLGILTVSNNPLLQSIDGLRNLARVGDLAGAARADFFQNGSLPACEIDALGERLAVFVANYGNDEEASCP